MSRFLKDGEECRKVLAAVEAGTARTVGGCEPCREMKGMGWRVVDVEGRLYACVTDGSGDVTETIEEIAGDELPLYDDGTVPPSPSPEGGEGGER